MLTLGFKINLALLMIELLIIKYKITMKDFRSLVYSGALQQINGMEEKTGMELIRPPKLRRGDTVGIFSPS
jgi:hypothetical protein